MKRLRFRSLLLLLFISSNIIIKAQKADPPFIKYLNHPWVDSVLKTLTPDEKIAQLIWVAGFSDKEIAYDVSLSDQIKKTGIGGIIFQRFL